MKLALHLLFILNTLIYMNHLLLAFQSLPTAALNPTNENDRLALLAFKDRIVGDPLGILTSWNESPHFCNWTGVLCSKKHQGRVTVLNLASQKLVGSIPPHIGNLSFLRGINLSYNSFTGEIPPQIGRLFRLRYLDLNYNNFHGKIPIELQNISKSLQVVQVAANQLIGSIPQMLGNASSLMYLSLARNNLQGSIPAELGKLLKLRFLQLSLNNLSGEVPLSIYNLSSLYLLSFAANQLHGRIPSDISFTLPNLRYFLAPENHFYGEVPTSFVNATKLGWLDLGTNNFSGGVPSNLGNLRNLTWLDLSGNQLESAEGEGLGFITSLTNCTNLRKLYLDQNNFKGVLPLSIANLSTKLETFTIGGNMQILGEIPEEIGNLVGLSRLVIVTTSITGDIPSSIGKLEKLSDLQLYENRISGPVPSSLGNITEMLTLQLQDNYLKGPIPPSLGNYSKLESLRLDSNFLFGSIPKGLFSLSHVLEVDLSQNSFTGQLPIDLAGGKMTNLLKLNVSHNRLSGGIPSALGDCLMLEGLWMSDNLFEGGIPSSFNNLKSLVTLDLSNNKLSGKIPEYFQNFPLLQYLNLSFNNFEGVLPTGRIFENASIISVAGNPKLCGGMHQLGLPSCKIKDRKLHRLIMLISIIASCSIFLMASLLVIFAYRRSKRKASTSTEVQDPEQYPKISYAELSQATNEFSSTNLIGKGSFGSVYKGILCRDGMPVAVKVLNLKRRGATKSFMAECETVKNIRHRNLIKIITICSSIDFRGIDFKALVYEFMQNGSLEEWLHPNGDQANAHNLSIVQRLNIAIEVASAIEYLHNYCQPSIVHGDLKPSNVLLDEEMVSHVGDFGLARFLSISQNQSSSMGVRGTIGYVAPEYGMSNKVSKYGDVYSFGILLLEMITGKRPTDSIFKDSFTIHQFVKTRLPERVIDIIDPSLLQEVQDAKNSEARKMRKGVGVLESLLAVAEVGLVCSMESPSERTEMKEVAANLYAIRDKFLDR
ncbi:hypothetical protein SLEP1_g57876 [Rubroshorea leprosula]|uniref:non-specific serine/threonine protein kinase n=1 Tax=Rubroshorea leprosula TaxID=152421 RepID=A0AAV5MS30_9ROSI|nr:hypothetical protein SLEP1_g57876 [Rubroshorea leprosula]